MTTYMNADAANRRVEIGSTWYRRSVQRTDLNTHCKMLLLTHAFEQARLHRRRVPHALLQSSEPAPASSGWAPSSTASCAAISCASDGTLRDTCVYSIIASEWPTVKSHLTWQLDEAPGPSRRSVAIVRDRMFCACANVRDRHVRPSARRRSPQRVRRRSDPAPTSIPSRATTCRPPSSGPTCCSIGPEFQYPEHPQRRRRADRPHGREGLRRQHRADRQRPPAHLQGAGRLDQPAGARPGGGLRRQARQPRADPLGQQPGDGGGVAGGHQGRRGGRQHHADAARRRARPRSSTRPRSALRLPTAASPTSWSRAPRTAAS